MSGRVYFCIDLKSFYASVECVERGLDPLTTDLVVADPERGSGTICLAVSPSLKAKGVKNRCRVFEIPEGLGYITASPRMRAYIERSADVYAFYLKRFSPDDIHVYSVDEVFIDVTAYLGLYGKGPRELAASLLAELKDSTGLPAACGIGTNLYLAKIALDITAKHALDSIGVLDEATYRKTLWGHTPLTDFWRVGKGVAGRLAQMGITTMAGVAHCSEETLYRIFGVDAELLIDHAWGRESVTIADIKAYAPKSNSYSSGQALARDYTWREAETVLKEMLGDLCLRLIKDNRAARSVTLLIEYGGERPAGRATARFETATNMDSVVVPTVTGLFRRRVDREGSIRKITVCCNGLEEETGERQVSIFESLKSAADPDKERRLRGAVLNLKERFGKNSVLKGVDLEACATGMERNTLIGGHKSGV